MPLRGFKAGRAGVRLGAKWEERSMRIVTLVLVAAAGCAPALAQTAAPSAHAAGAGRQEDAGQKPPRSATIYALPPPPRGPLQLCAGRRGLPAFRPQVGRGRALQAAARPAGPATPVRGQDRRRAADRAGRNDKAIAALSDEVAGLKKEIAGLRAAAASAAASGAAGHRAADRSDRQYHASSSDIARARGFIADTWRRLVDMIEGCRRT